MSSEDSGSNNQETLNTEQVQSILTASRFGQKIVYLPTTASTNSEAKELLNEGCEEGTVVISEIQTKGRGRLERGWESPHGGLWFSTILKPSQIKSEKLPVLSLMAGTAVAESISELFTVKIHLKWPNDIMISEKKLGGILTESVYSGEDLKGVIIGIGLNIDMKLESLPEELHSTAVTLRSTLGDTVEISRENILARIIDKLELYYKLFQAGQEGELLERWKTYSTTIGSKVSIKLEDGNELVGVAEGLTDSGALILKTEEGETQNVIAGDCIHLKKEL